MSLYELAPLNDKYVLLSNNQPFKSKLQASKELGITPKTITRYVNTNNNYKGLYFFKTKQ
jgi:hypothetical protein